MGADSGNSRYLLMTICCCYLMIWHALTLRRRREQTWPPLGSAEADSNNLLEAWAQSSVVLGHDANGKPWLWPDSVRVMQGIVLGQTGSARRRYSETSLRRIGTHVWANRRSPQIPMVIFDGKGDSIFSIASHHTFIVPAGCRISGF